MSLLDEVGAYLVSQGVGTAVDTDVFLGKVPASPDTVWALIHYGGLPDETENLTQGTTVRREFPRFQLVTRAGRDDYQTAYANARAAKTALTRVANQNLSGTRYLAILCENGPFFQRRDDNDRVEIVANFQVDGKDPS